VTPLGSRVGAIDVMRGLTLALMIIVNMSISEQLSYAPLLHATWHGLTLTDVVFPSFLFVVGSAMAFTIDRYQAAGTRILATKVVSRTAIIFLCGFLLSWFPFVRIDAAGITPIALADARILGVLQRIALCYALAALLIHVAGERGAGAVAVLALLINWWIFAACGDDTLAGSAALRLDRWLLGEAHLYRGEGVPFDPEGVLGTLPATANVLAGYLAGRLVRRLGASHELVARLCVAAAAALVVALAWSMVLPFNKKLWTSSYALVAIGIDLAALGVLVFVVDLRRSERLAGFFAVFGRNTLVIYLFAELLMSVMWLLPVGDQALFMWLYENGFQAWAGDKPGSLLFALALMLLCWWLGRSLDQRGIHIRA
jgi:predicted acyltransferase